MQKERQRTLNSEDWTTVREFSTNESGDPLPKYEAKLVKGVGKRYLEDEIVLLRETDGRWESERTYQLPKQVFENVGTLVGE